MKEHPPWGPVRKHQCHAVELASRRWRGGHNSAVAETRKFDSCARTNVEFWRIRHLKVHLRGLSANQPVSPVHRDNLFYALSLAENDGISIFGAAGASNLGMSVWKSNFGQLTPSTRRKRNSLVDFYAGTCRTSAYPSSERPAF